LTQCLSLMFCPKRFTVRTCSLHPRLLSLYLLDLKHDRVATPSYQPILNTFQGLKSLLTPGSHARFTTFFQPLRFRTTSWYVPDNLLAYIHLAPIFCFRKKRSFKIKYNGVQGYSSVPKPQKESMPSSNFHHPFTLLRQNQSLRLIEVSQKHQKHQKQKYS
jgi:hypothetical protein